VVKLLQQVVSDEAAVLGGISQPRLQQKQTPAIRVWMSAE
jgi:hypothetical protein